MKVVLHIGTPKTGSSALQYFLNENRKQLARHGYYYPKHNFDSNQISGGHGSLARFIDDGELDKARAQLDTWLKAAARKNLVLLLSAEGFYTQAKTLPLLFEGHELSVAAFVRHPVEFVIANHNQSVKRHFGTQTLQNVLEKVPQSQNRGVNGELLFEWAEAVGRDNLSVLAYHKPSLPKGRVEFAFLKWLGVSGLSLSGFRVPERLINTSYAPEALELKRLLNTVLIQDDRTINHQVDIFLQHYSDRRNNETPRRAGGLPVQPAVLRSAYQAFEDSNARLLKELVQSPPKGFLKTPYSLGEPEVPDALGVLTLGRAMTEKLPEVSRYLQARVEENLTQRRVPYAIYKLADVIGIPYSEPETPQVMREEFLRVFRAPKTVAADHLRALAQFLVSEDYKNEALNVIRQAEKQRPNGPVIRDLRIALEKRFKG
ncbi:hypothetical protein [Marinobacter sp. W-8]|uniref:hypothetical protein n=1 Tax=Marinobacter sp. W-8 TaxID=3369658 RepID=UPI0037CB03ED